MNNRFETIVNLEEYPIQNLNSPKIKELIKKCKSDLDQFSCATIPNFILSKSLKIPSLVCFIGELFPCFNVQRFLIFFLKNRCYSFRWILFN